MRRAPAVLLLLLAVLLPVVAACSKSADATPTPVVNVGTATAGPDDLLSVRGQVLEVVAGDILDLESLVLKDEAGREWLFVGEGFVGETPSHLRQHALLGQAVTIRYRATEDGTLIVVRVED